jgi:hypothetical protein
MATTAGRFIGALFALVLPCAFLVDCGDGGEGIGSVADAGREERFAEGVGDEDPATGRSGEVLAPEGTRDGGEAEELQVLY